MSRETHIELLSHDATVALGVRLSRIVRPGLLIELHGDLGAGKTTLVQGLMQGLGWSGEAKSPTFAIMYEYESEPPVLHVDLYRLEDSRGLGIEEYLETRVVIVEWAERLSQEFREYPRLSIRLEPHGEGRLAIINDLGANLALDSLLPLA